MKKFCLFFITLLCASISLSIRSAEAGGEKTFSLKNSDKSGAIYFIAINGGNLQVGAIPESDVLDGVFDTDETTRLYIWEENIENLTNRELREELKAVVLGNHGTQIDQIDFPFKPNWVFEFPVNKTMHVKWKKGELQPRDGKSKKGMGKYTKDGYSLRNNVTKSDIKSSAWKFDEETGQWRSHAAEFKQDLDNMGLLTGS